MKLFFLLCFGLANGALGAQTRVNFQADLGAAAGAVSVDVLRFYLSEVTLLRNGEVIFSPEKRHHLLDAEFPDRMQIDLDHPPGLTYDALRFTLGVDSLTSAAGVFGGDLDPTLGMYWTWRSGYVHFKLEGTAPDCPARKHRFQYHIGGYQAPFNTLRQLTLPVTPTRELKIKIDLNLYFAAFHPAREYRIMSPSATALRAADVLATLFSVLE
ncbi:MAG: MbnP family protein [Bacteroidota bacterium]